MVNENLYLKVSKWVNFILKASAKNSVNRFKNREEFKSILTHDNWKIDQTNVVDKKLKTVIENVIGNEKNEKINIQI
jgi:hypothetical protein